MTGGLVAYPFSEAWDVLRYYRDVTASLPDELTVFGGLLHAPDGSGTKLVAIVVCHCGSLVDGEKAVQPIKSFGSPAMDVIGTVPYCDMNTMLDGGFPRGALNYWKSAFLAGLSDEAIRTMIDCFAKCPTPMGALMLEHFHGAVTRVGPTDTAFPHRDVGLQSPRAGAVGRTEGQRVLHRMGAGFLFRNGRLHGTGTLRQLSG